MSSSDYEVLTPGGPAGRKAAVMAAVPENGGGAGGWEGASMSQQELMEKDQVICVDADDNIIGFDSKVRAESGARDPSALSSHLTHTHTHSLSLSLARA